MKSRFLVFLFFSVFPVLPILASTGDVAVVLNVKEGVFLKRGREILPLNKGDILQVGDKIEVGSKGIAIIKFLDKNAIVTVKENTVLKVKDGGKDKKVSILSLLMGKIVSKLKSTIMGERFMVETPAAVAAVKGTEFSTSFISDTTKVGVKEGIVELRNDKGAILLKKGEVGIAVAGKAPKKVLRKMKIGVEIR